MLNIPSQFSLSSFFKEVKPEINPTEKKWKDLALNQEWITDYYDDVDYLVKTKLIYSILVCQNSTSQGLKLNEIKVDFISMSNEKGLWIKKEGEWTPVALIRKEIVWDKKSNALITKDCEVEKWSYYSDQGLLPIHTAYEKQLVSHPLYSKKHVLMHPVTRLSKVELDQLLSSARPFVFKSKLSEDSLPITGALQFVTHPNLRYQHPLLQNLNTQMVTHCGMRLVMPDGAVYSFGLGGEFTEHSIKSKSFQWLATINGQPKNIDYTEFQKHENTIVTTVPLNDFQSETILKQLNFYRSKGIRFNLLKQNCVRFGTHLLNFAGVSLNTRVSFSKIVWRALPNIECFPLFGSRLSKLKKFAQKQWQNIASKIPSIVKEIFALSLKVAFYLPNRLLTFALNIGMIAMGGRIASPNISLNLEKNNSSQKLENFEVLVPNVFDNESLYVYHSSSLIRWQLNQKTTEVYHYIGQPKMFILPPDSESELKYSKEQKKRFKVIYQEFS